MKILTKPLPNDQGLAFLSHSLQIMLFGPFTYEPSVVPGPLKIVSLQNPIKNYLLLNINK